MKRYQVQLERRANCEGLRECNANTIALLEKLHLPTVDLLVHWCESDAASRKDAVCGDQVFTLKIGEINKIEREADKHILDAKNATLALFLEREARAWQTGLPRYAEFLDMVFDGNHHRAFLESPHSDCVLSFNYDRLFEMAFADYFQLNPAECYQEKLLNTGLDLEQNQATKFADQFCFLKLHGTAAISVAKGQGGKLEYRMIPLQRAEVIVNDDVIWPSRGKSPQADDKKPEPLIVFPHEKKRALRQRTAFVFDDYVNATWKQAEKVIEDCEQIWVVGYSFAVVDRSSVFELLLQNKWCCDIIVQGPEAERICNELRLRHRDFASRLKPLSNSF
jgi:hypothetical protein